MGEVIAVRQTLQVDDEEAERLILRQSFFVTVDKAVDRLSLVVDRQSLVIDRLSSVNNRLLPVVGRLSLVIDRLLSVVGRL